VKRLYLTSTHYLKHLSLILTRELAESQQYYIISSTLIDQLDYSRPHETSKKHLFYLRAALEWVSFQKTYDIRPANIELLSYTYIIAESM
jgi:hypothetical protein